jgi:hypothetical protein
VTTPLAPVSWGELLDKISILEIKAERMTHAPALANVRNELAQLNDVARAAKTTDGTSDLPRLRAELKRVNESLWQIEDEIRAHDSAAQAQSRP